MNLVKYQNNALIVNANIPEKRKIVCEASTKTKIVQIDNETLVITVNKLSEGLIRDLGLRNVDAYQKVRFLDLLKKYYKDLSISEVKLAFEYLMIGYLDEYLSKDSQGKPDRKHYQSFSAEYICKVLNAFREYKGEAWRMLYKSLPEKSNEPSPDQIKEINRTFLIWFVNVFDYYNINNTLPFIVSHTYYFNELIKHGLIDSEPVLTNDFKESIIAAILLGKINVSHSRKKKLVQNIKTGENPKELERFVNEKRHRIEIGKYFDKLIKEKKELKDLIK